MNNFAEYTIKDNESIINAFSKICFNKKNFLIVLNEKNQVIGTLTDGDLRRFLIKNSDLNSNISKSYSSNYKSIDINNNFEDVIEIFKNNEIKFLPVLNSNKKLVNIITKQSLHTLLLKDYKFDINYDFLSVDDSLLNFEICSRPWGFYKTTLMNNYFQSKIICIYPNERLSLQYHKRREEHWIVVHGNARIQIGESIIEATVGQSFFIPKECKHTAKNLSTSESLVISEVQTGDYFGEDDIVRLDDKYGRNSNINDKIIDISRIKMLLTDCDGCLTDGGMYYSENGDELKKFNTRDGVAFSLLKNMGIFTGIVTTENVKLNERRAKKMSLDIYEPNCKNKLEKVKDLCTNYNIDLKQVAYVGDDINDLEVFKNVGLSFCPNDACSEIKSIANYISSVNGGDGIIRDVVNKYFKYM